MMRSPQRSAGQGSTRPVKPCEPCPVSITKPELSALLASAHRVPERERIAAFLRDPATEIIDNPFSATRAAAARNTWAGRGFDFRVMGVEAAGLTDLLSALAELPASEPLVENIARSGPHTASIVLSGDRSRVVGVALYGKPGTALPRFVAPRPRHRAVASTQLDLFADAG
ncbi:hypothetical protein OFEAOIEE_LOCUS986 [Methylorubrum extorquens]